MLQVELTLLFFSISIFLYGLIKRRPKSPLAHLPLPPGPKGLPIIGNLRDLPASFEWQTYHKWSKELDTDILYVNAMGTPLIILDTSEAATELLEKRSSIYSNRAHMPMILDLMGWDFNFGFMPYGERWRRHRRLMHSNFHPRAAVNFRPHTLKAVHNLLNRFIDTPNDIIGNLRHMAGETIMSIAYGLPVLPTSDPYVSTAEQAVHGLVTAGVPGAFLVDTLPWLRHVPSWVPGAGFQRKAREWKKLARQMIEGPYAVTKARIATGVSPPCFTSLSLQKMEERPGDDTYHEDIIQGTAGTMYTAGSDTTVSAIASCLLGLLERPDVLAKAQAELDAVVRPGEGLPDWEHEERLPYVTAIVKETLRWRDVVPIAIPRYMDVEDEYKGYRIPKGAIVIPNAWAMLHNDATYPDPFTFNPDRFIKDGKLNKSIKDPAHACWGFGRRVCPGRYMAFSAVWIAVASLISAFEIKKKVRGGEQVELSHEYTSGLVCTPKPFECEIRPRSEEVVKCVRAAVREGGLV